MIEAAETAVGTESFAVRFRSAEQGDETFQDATVALRPDALAIVVGESHNIIRLNKLDGLVLKDGQLELHQDSRVVAFLRADSQSTSLHQKIEAASLRVPEVTRQLRTLGVAPFIGPDHDEFFEPFLNARRAAEGASSAEQRQVAFRAQNLVTAVEHFVGRMGAARFPQAGPDQRATAERLLELAQPVFDALSLLEQTAAEFTAAPAERRFRSWRQWCAQLGALFREVDHCWELMAPLLQQLPVASPRQRNFFRRILPLLCFLLLPTIALSQQRMVRVVGIDPDSLRARDFDVASALGDEVMVVASVADEARLRALGWEFTVTPPPSMEPAFQRYATTEGNIYRSYDDPQRGIAFFLDSIARANSNVHLDTIGYTLEKRPILVVKVGARDDSPVRANVLFMATLHAREWAATQMAERLLKHLVTAKDSRTEALLRTRDIWIMPVANPDGYEYTFTTDRFWRKNRSAINSSGNVDGVDLNRNLPYLWGKDEVGSSSSPFSATYRGPAPASELETQAIIAFHRRHPPVASISYHTYTGLVLFPPGNTNGILPGDITVFRTLAGVGSNSAVRDNLPGARNPFYHPGPGWTLYPTNGEYTDWAYATFGTLAFTPELTSGYEGTEFYGFRFPEDEFRLETVFQDNLPFAYDVLDAAGEPVRFSSPTTGLEPERIVLESISPSVRVLVPASRVPTATVRSNNELSVTLDVEAAGHFSKRLISASAAGRPASVSIQAGGLSHDYLLLAANGAEADDTPWEGVGFEAGPGGVVGAQRWRGTDGTLTSPQISVADIADTLSVLFWTRFSGSAYDTRIRGFVQLSLDDGATWSNVGEVAGSAPVYYPERVTITGVRGQQVRIRFFTAGMAWNIDEIAVVAHTAVASESAGKIKFVPSANPVRSDRVYFPWPFELSGGDIALYDFVGRRVLYKEVPTGDALVFFDFAEQPIANGVYIVVARSGNSTIRFTLYILR